MIADLANLLLIAACTATAIVCAWYALGAYATRVDTREDDEPERDWRERR